MIYLLTTHERMPFWYEGFCRELITGLQAKGVRVEVMTSMYSIKHLSSIDTLFVTSYKDLSNKALQLTDAKIVYYHQGSGACPYFEFIDSEAEQLELQVVDLHLFSLPTFEKLVKEKYNLKNTATIGFPLDLSVYEKYRLVPKKKKIVVSGHITPGKQFYLATYLLKDLMPEYEIWFSVIEQNTTFKAGVDDTWSTFYALKRFEDMGFKFVFNHATQEKFYEFLSDACHVFTCSLADTISLPIVEGALCGAIPVTPCIKDYWGQYMDYLDFGYVPFDKYNIEEFIRWQCKISLDTKYFDSKLVVKRLLELI